MSLLLVARRGVGKGYIAMPPGGGIHAIKISASLTQDLVGLTELAVLSLQGLELGGHVRGQARLAPAVSLGPANPLMQRLRRAADLRGNRSHRRPPRGMILLVLENQPNRKRAHFRRKSVRCLACHRSTFSRLGASGKPGAVQQRQPRGPSVALGDRTTPTPGSSCARGYFATARRPNRDTAIRHAFPSSSPLPRLEFGKPGLSGLDDLHL